MTTGSPEDEDEATPVRKAPRWRALADFEPLNEAEQDVLACCLEGEPALFGNRVPSPVEDRRVRGTFVRFLALGGDEHALVSDKPVKIKGAFISGPLNLDTCVVRVPIMLHNCLFETPIEAYAADLMMFSLDGSHVPGLNLDSAIIRGDLFLRHGFEARGPVRVNGTTIHGHFECGGGSFLNPGGTALNAQSMVVHQGFIWRDVEKVSGAIVLVAARVATLNDNFASWRLADNIVLDGFRYDRIDSLEVDAQQRIEWLNIQNPAVYGERFWPQPWEQLARILRELGHTEDARLVAMEKQRQMRRLGIIGNRKAVPRSTGPGRAIEKGRIAAINTLTRILHRLYGALAGYGYRPLRTLGWMLILWVVAILAFTWADQRGLFVPTKPASQAAAAQPSAVKASSFSPVMYALDTLLPLVDLKQEGDWAPAVERADGTTIWAGWPIRVLMWAEIIFGWIASLLLVSAVGRLVQKE